MASFRVEWRASVYKDMRKLPQEANAKNRRSSSAARGNPYPSGVKKLARCQNTFRIRVGDYRLIYEVHTAEHHVMIQRVRHRKDVYRE